MSTTYTVIRQAPDQYDFTVPGDPVVGTIVYYVTGNGNHGSVFVPAARYNVKVVKEMVAAAAKVTDEVGAISG